MVLRARPLRCSPFYGVVRWCSESRFVLRCLLRLTREAALLGESCRAQRERRSRRESGGAADMAAAPVVELLASVVRQRLILDHSGVGPQ